MRFESTQELCQWWLSEVHDALALCGRPKVSRAYVGAGIAAWDDCCGLLVVSPMQVYRYLTFPVPVIDVERCLQGLLAVNLQVTLVRCAPTVNDKGRAPEASALNAAHTSLLEDAAVIWNRANGAIPTDWERTAVQQTFIGQQGGCIAVDTTFTIGLNQTDWHCCGGGE